LDADLSHHRSALYDTIQMMRASTSDEQVPESSSQRAESPISAAVELLATSPLARFTGRSRSIGGPGLADTSGLSQEYIHTQAQIQWQNPTRPSSASFGELAADNTSKEVLAAPNRYGQPSAYGSAGNGDGPTNSSVLVGAGLLEKLESTPVDYSRMRHRRPAFALGG
jgi:hypothetical protein